MKLWGFVLFLGCSVNCFADTYHEVIKGENLSKILKIHGYTPIYGKNNYLNKICKLNHIKNPNKIYVKQIIKLTKDENFDRILYIKKEYLIYKNSIDNNSGKYEIFANIAGINYKTIQKSNGREYTIPVGITTFGLATLNESTLHKIQISMVSEKYGNKNNIAGLYSVKTKIMGDLYSLLNVDRRFNYDVSKDSLTWNNGVSVGVGYSITLNKINFGLNLIYGVLANANGHFVESEVSVNYRIYNKIKLNLADKYSLEESNNQKNKNNYIIGGVSYEF